MATEEVDLLGGPDNIPQSDYINIGSDRYRTVKLYLPSLVASKKLESHWKRLGGLSFEIGVLNKIINTPSDTYSRMLSELDLNAVENNPLMVIDNAFQQTDPSLQIRALLKELVQMANFYKIKHSQTSNHQFIFPPRCEFFCDTSYVQIFSLFTAGFLCAARHNFELAEVLPLEFLCSALLEAPDVGVQVILYMAVNRPECFHDIIGSLIKSGDNSIKSGRIGALLKLAQLSKYAALTIREECITSQVLPEVIFNVTLDSLRDEVPFITSLVSSQGLEDDKYITAYFASVPEPKTANELRSSLWEKINTFKDNTLLLSEALRALCAIHCRLGIPGTEIEEKRFIPDLIQKTNDTEIHKLLFACLYSWPNGRKETIGPCIRELSVAGRIPQIFLLAAVLLHTDKKVDLRKYIEKILDFPLGFTETTGQNSQGFVQVLTREILPLEACCGRAPELPHVTEDTQPAVADATFHSFHVLLEQNFFAKHRVDPGSWLVPQILSGGLPVHPLFIEAISSYTATAVRQCIREEQGQDQRKWNPTIISEEEARRALGMPYIPMRKCRGLIPLPLSCGLPQPKTTPIVRPREVDRAVREDRRYGAGARYLVALFVLEYSEAWTGLKGGLKNPYLDDFLWNIPIRKILSDARSDPRCAGALTARLAALAMSQFPHHVDPELLLLHSIGSVEEKAKAEKNGSERIVTKKQLSGNEKEEELETYATKWLEEFTQDPWGLSLAFVNSGAGRATSRALTHGDIITDLTTVLRTVDRKALRSPNLIRIILSVLKMYRSVTRKMLFEQEALQPQRSEEIHTFITAQDTALVQILLEVCLENNPMLPPPQGPASLAAVRALICDFVHHLFIEDPDLITIVHAQGYNEDLVPVIVHGIPSVYLCQEFLPALLTRTDLKDKIFAVKLGVALAQEYKTEQLYNVMGLVIDTIHNFHKTPFKGDPGLFLFKSIPFLSPLIKAFPCYKENVLSALRDLLDVTNADAYTNIDLIRIIKQTIDEINTQSPN